MKRVTIWLLYVFVLLSFFSCVRENDVHIEKKGNFFLELMIEGQERNTRAVTYEEEKINSIDLILFTVNMAQNKELFYKHIIPADKDIVKNAQGNITGINFELDEYLVENNIPSRIMIIANAGSIVSDYVSGMAAGSVERRIFHEELAFTDYGWKISDTRDFPFDLFPMCGIYPGLLIPNPGGEKENIQVKLYQSMARIDVGVDIYQTHPGTRDKFKINKIWVCGTNPGGRIPRHYDERLTKPETDLVNLPAGNIRVVDDVNAYDFPAGDNFMQKRIYVPESLPLDLTNAYTYRHWTGGGMITYNVMSSEIADKPYNGTFLILEANLNGNTENRYFRIDFYDRGEYLNIIRNNRYEINIVNVSHDGYSTKEQAMKNVYGNNTSRAVNKLDVEIRIIK